MADDGNASVLESAALLASISPIFKGKKLKGEGKGGGERRLAEGCGSAGSAAPAAIPGAALPPGAAAAAEQPPAEHPPLSLLASPPSSRSVPSYFQLISS